jgi:carbon monoxide dehydrogenase subunit G
VKTLAEETIELDVPVAELFRLLADIKSYSRLFSLHTTDWSFEGDVADLVYDGSTHTKLKIYERVPNEKIMVGTFGNNTIDFDFELLLSAVEPQKSRLHISIKSDTNPVFASMMESSVLELKKDFLDELRTWIKE